jgi:CHASE1-domain containing sensor protein
MRNDQETILRKVRGRWITAAAVTVLIAGWFFSWRLVEQVDRNMRIDLLQQAQLIGQTLNVERIQALSGTEADRHSPDFQRLREQLLTLRSANPQCRGLYLLGRRADGTIFFLVHGEPDQGKDASPPGPLPAEAAEVYGNVFARQTPMVAGPNTDRRGPWVSGLVPIHDPQAALFGLATPADARAMVQKAATYYRSNGRESLLREINNPQGAFVQKELYVFAYDSGMTMQAHPVKPELVGKNQLGIKDWPGGKYFRQEIQDIALAKGSGWVDYEYENPANKQRDPKTTYIERLDDLILCAGAYKGTGATLAVLGMDIDARDWNRALIRTVLPSGLGTLALAAILLAGGALSARRSRFELMPPPWMQPLETVLVVAVGAILSVLMAWEIHQQELRSRGQVFAQQMNSQTQLIVTTLHTLRDNELEGLAHFYEGSEDVTADEFRQFSTYLTKNPATSVWQWISAVPAGERSRFEASARAAGLTGFAIWQKDGQGQRIPAAEREVYYPVLRIAPMAGNESLLGYDIGSEPQPLAAMEAAVRSGLPGATVSLRLGREADEQKGLRIFRPVFGGLEAKQLRGFVQPVLRLETLLRGGGADSLANLELSLLHRDASPETLATTWDADSPPVAGLVWKRPIFAFGQVFGITAYARPEFWQTHPLRAGWLTLLVGFTLTAALALVVRATGHRREELERLVTERTLALQESEQSYRNQFANNAGMMLLIDPGDGAIIDANGAAAAFYGFSREQLLAMQMADIDILSPAEVQQALASVPQGLGETVRMPASPGRWHAPRGGSAGQQHPVCRRHGAQRHYP